ncbi:hypothetical protein NKH77_28365 [Streptomyces sp. M19]
MSTAEVRTGYTNARLGALLWAPDVRWHREAAGTPTSPAGFRLSAVEVVRLDAAMSAALADMDTQPEANAVALLHGSLPEDPPGNCPGGSRTAPTSTRVGNGARRSARGWRACCPGVPDRRDRAGGGALHPGHGQDRSAAPAPGRAHEEWDAADQWLWRMYRATVFEPDPWARGQLDSMRIPLPVAVRGVVGTRGLTLVGVRPRTCPVRTSATTTTTTGRATTCGPSTRTRSPCPGCGRSCSTRSGTRWRGSVSAHRAVGRSPNWSGIC